MNSKTSEAWAIVSKCVRRQLGGKVSDGDLTIIILAAAQHALEESAEHFSASQVCEVVQRLVSREESAKTPGSIRVVGVDPKATAALGLENPHKGMPAAPRKSAEFDQLIGNLRSKHAGTLNSPEARARLQTEIAGFMMAQRDAPLPSNVELDDERSDLPNGKIAFRVRVSPELAAAIERQRE